ncbi:hypothetical protein L7F22_022284 [Adiantum nelumboides]|nr:hypothetical protein [Adiantum nelumboides]
MNGLYASLANDSPPLISCHANVQMKSAIALLTPDHPKRWGVAPNQSPLLSTLLSRQAMTMDYQLHHHSEVAQLSKADIARQWKAFDIEGIKTDVDEGDHPAATDTGTGTGRGRMRGRNNMKAPATKSSWVSAWLSTPARVFRSSIAPSSSSSAAAAALPSDPANLAGIKKLGPKKRSSWLPDPNNRWPQGW